MFCLSCSGVITSNSGPAVLQNDDALRAFGDDGFNGEDHAGLHHARIIVGHVVNVGRSVKVRADPVSSKGAHDPEPVVEGVGVNVFTERGKGFVGSTTLQSNLQTFLGDLDKFLAVFVDVSDEES